jgi:hydroxyacid-oxoacid transhydrogenase
VKGYAPSTGYDGWDKGLLGKQKTAFVPHGLSVVLTAPAVFKWTAAADPDKHLQAAQLLGANINNVKAADAGLLIADTLVNLLGRWQAFVPDGLNAVGYTNDHLEMLVKGTLPQKKVLDVSPRKVNPDDIRTLISDSMRLFS